MAGRRTEKGTDGEAVVGRLAAEKVRWVQLFYTDVFGGYNQVDVPRTALEAEMFRSGVPKLDGSSVRGFREIFESDMLLVPDPATIANIPWNPEVGRTVRFICDVRLGGSSESYAHDPRGVARRTEKVLADAGYEQVYDIDEIITRMPTPEEIARLGIPAGTPVAEHIRTGYTATDKPVRVMISVIPGDTLILQYTIPT